MHNSLYNNLLLLMHTLIIMHTFAVVARGADDEGYAVAAPMLTLGAFLGGQCQRLKLF